MYFGRNRTEVPSCRKALSCCHFDYHHMLLLIILSFLLLSFLVINLSYHFALGSLRCISIFSSRCFLVCHLLFYFVPIFYIHCSIILYGPVFFLCHLWFHCSQSYILVVKSGFFVILSGNDFTNNNITKGQTVICHTPRWWFNQFESIYLCRYCHSLFI